MKSKDRVMLPKDPLAITLYVVRYLGFIRPRYGVFVSEENIREYFQGARHPERYKPVAVVLRPDFATLESHPPKAGRVRRFFKTLLEKNLR